MSRAQAVLKLEWPDNLLLTNCVRALRAFEPLVSGALVRGQTLECHLIGWCRVDTSALAVLIALRRLAVRADVRIEFVNAPDSLKALARVSQVDGLLSLQ